MESRSAISLQTGLSRLALALLLAAGPAVAENKADALAREHALEAVTTRVYNEAALRLRWGDFDGLEQLYTQGASAELRDNAEMPLGDQQWSVSAALGNWSPADTSSDRAFEAQQAALLAWAQRRPDLAAAHIAYADALTQQAWAVRGGTYAREVPEAQMQRFKALSGQALRYLREHRKQVEASDYGQVHVLMAMQNYGSEPEAIWDQARDYVRVNPTSRNIYRFLGNAFSPRWYGAGDGSSLEYAARESIKLSRDRIGMSAYALIYSSAASTEYGAGLFENSPARWPDMKQGFEDVLRISPTFEWRNRYAYFACLAKDRQTLREQLALLGDERKRFVDRWGSTGARTQAECVRFAEQT